MKISELLYEWSVTCTTKMQLVVLLKKKDVVTSIKVYYIPLRVNLNVFVYYIPLYIILAVSHFFNKMKKSCHLIVDTSFIIMSP